MDQEGGLRPKFDLDGGFELLPTYADGLRILPFLPLFCSNLIREGHIHFIVRDV